MPIENFNQIPEQPKEDTEQEIQKRREERYKKSVEAGHNYETRETIDIFETPLLFRADTSILQFLEVERRGNIRERDITKENIKGRHYAPDIHKEKSMIFMESPLPFFISQSHEFPLYNIEVVDIIKKGDDAYFSDPDVKSSFEKTADLWVAQFPDLDKDSIVDLLYKTTLLAYSGERGEQSGRGGYSQEEITERQGFLREVFNNEKYKKIWLAGQKMYLGKSIATDIKEELRESNNDYGLHSAKFMSRGTFLIDPIDSDLFTIPASQTHGDFSFEVTAIKNLPVENILGYLEYIQEDSDETISSQLNSALEKEKSEYGGLYTNFFLTNEGRTYSQVTSSIFRTYESVQFYREGVEKGNSAQGNLDIYSEKLSQILDCPAAEFSDERINKIIKDDKHLYKRYSEIYGLRTNLDKLLTINT